MCQSLGTAGFAGMLGTTLLGLLFAPAFYLLTRWIGSLFGKRAKPEHEPAAEPQPH